LNAIADKQALAPSEAAVAAMKNVADLADNPFRCLDDSWIPLALTFVVAKGRLVASLDSFCMSVSIQESKGLTLPAFRWVLARLTDAHVAARHKGEWDLMSDFHFFCAEALRKLRAEHEKELREQDDQKPRNDVDGNRKQVAATILSMADATELPKKRKGRTA
jgi:hypothetical protein